MTRLKHFLFRNYLGIFLLLLGASIGVLFLPGYLKIQAFLTIVGGLAAFFFFVQKQQLEETALFRELFREFNSRYDTMNEDLNRIITGSEENPLRKKEVAILFNYFNLCAEEYLYYVRGYTYPEVWESWRNGMMIFFRDKRIWDVWVSEAETQSYYGLDQELARWRKS
jgi:hypothetical protein